MAMVAGRGQEQDVYMTSRPLVLGSEPTSSVSVVHTHAHTARVHRHTHTRSLEEIRLFSLELIMLHVIKRYARKGDFVRTVLYWCGVLMTVIRRPVNAVIIITVHCGFVRVRTPLAYSVTE